MRRFLEDRPIQAQPASPPERVFRLCRRNPWVAPFLVALTLGVIASAWQALLDEHEPSRSRSNVQGATKLYLCRAYLWAGRRDDSLVAGRCAIEIFRTLVHDQPEEFEYSMRLNRAHQEVALTHLGAEQAD